MAFEELTPEEILKSVENATGYRLTGLTSSLPSYINRVYELCTIDGTRLIAKFYRPGRWSRAALDDEHRFVLDCQESELSVVAPIKLNDNQTIGVHNGILFALYPKRAGRQLEITNDSDLVRLGSLVARLHLVGETRQAQNRVILDPQLSTRKDIDYLCSSVIPEQFRQKYHSIAIQLVETITPLFLETERIRIHGDCHRGNILDRMDEGLLLIDFDDMAMGPAVQDLWLLLQGRAADSRKEIDAFIQGYELFRHFDRSSIVCIEGLRAMRMIYFLAWCSRQIDDFVFKRNFPAWGSNAFWQQEINDLYEQMEHIYQSTESLNL